jgi:hypothetical protein
LNGGRLCCCVEIDWEDLIDGEVLRGEDAVEAFEGEGSFAIEEVGDVGLLEAGLLREAALGESTAFDAPGKFEAKEFVQFLKVHGRGLSWASHSI